MAKKGGGPFINWSSPGSIISSPFRGALAGGRALGGAIEGAGRGLINLPIAGGKELFNAADTGYHDLLHPSLNNAVNAQAQNPGPVNESFQQEVADLSKQQPLTGPFLGSLATTGADFEQIARAAGNTITPGQPFGSNVGQLGSGAGLLGRTDYAKDAAAGGPGVTARLIGDATNIATLGQPIEGLIGDAAKEAAAQAATHGEALATAQEAEKGAQAAAEQNVKLAQEQADEAIQRADEARTAAASGHPLDAAQVQVTQNAAEEAQRAVQSAQAQAAQVAAEHANNVSMAQDLADTTQAHADTLQQHLKAVQTVTKLGSKVANSPFATAEFGAGKLLDAAAPIAHSIVGTDLGQRYLAPVIDRAKQAATQMAANREVGNQRLTADIDQRNIDAQLQRGFTNTVAPLPTVDQPVKRGPGGLFGTKTVPVQDPDAQAVAIMAQTQEGAHLGNLLRDLPRAEAIDTFARANPNSYTPEQLNLAADVFGPGEAEGKAATLRAAIPQVRAAYSAPGGALDVQNRQYAQLKGEAEVPGVRPTPGPGAFAQVEHNLAGQGPRIEGLEQWQQTVAEHAKASEAVRSSVEDPQAQQRALDRLDQGLAEKQRAFEASVEAQPRAQRPVLELGQRIHDVLVPMADQADANLGAGAGDVYRALASEATITAEELFSRYGLDPQYLIGEREGETRGPVLGGWSAQPKGAATGQREAGVGLKHATDYGTLLNETQRRADQVVENMAAQRVLDAHAGSLGDLLKQRGVPDAATMTGDELAEAMKDARLSEWRFSDGRDRAPLSTETTVVPTEIWKAWDRYSTHPTKDNFGQTLLRGYDKVTRSLKQLNRLSPRWQASVTMGHSVMAMVGIGADPITYFGHDVPAAIHLDRMARTGEVTGEDAAWLAKQSPEVQRAVSDAGGFVPGAVRNRGFVREEFPSTTADRAKIGDRGASLQASLDNVNRTAVWIHQLEKGLDSTGLADFRKAYPDLAHLSDSEIQNEAAIRLSIRTMGDYLNKTPAERQIMSRVVYFYPWLKHITQLAVNTAIHDPLRTAWILHLGAMFDPGPGPLNFLQSSYNTGTNKWVTPPSWNPFDALNPVGDNPLGSFNPLIKAGVGGLTGYNLGTGKPITRPAGESGPLGLGEFANFAANQSPVIAAARQTIPALIPGGGQPVVRYQTGQPIISGGKFIPSNEQQFPGTDTMMPGALSPLAGLTGLPQQRIINADEITAAELKAEQRNAKSQQSYQRRRRIINAQP